jgi:hypothetical protein
MLEVHEFQQLFSNLEDHALMLIEIYLATFTPNSSRHMGKNHCKILNHYLYWVLVCVKL